MSFMQIRISAECSGVFVRSLFLIVSLAVHRCLRQSSSLSEACLILKIPFSVADAARTFPSGRNARPLAVFAVNYGTVKALSFLQQTFSV